MKTSGSFKPGNKIGTTAQKQRAGRIGKSRSPWRFFASQGVERRAEQQRVGPARERGNG